MSRKRGPSSPLAKACIVSSSSIAFDPRDKMHEDGIEHSSMPMSIGRVLSDVPGLPCFRKK